MVLQELDIGKEDMLLGLTWLKENEFVVDPIDRCLRNVSTRLVIPYSVWGIPTVSFINLKEEALEDSKVLLILDVSERYSRYAQVFSTKQADRLPKHKL